MSTATYYIAAPASDVYGFTSAARGIPYFLYIAAPASMPPCGIPYFLYIAAPASMPPCGIPYFLYIKKSRPYMVGS